MALLHGGFVAALSGDAAAAVRTMHDVAGQPWAAAHLCDLLWQAGVRCVVGKDGERRCKGSLARLRLRRHHHLSPLLPVQLLRAPLVWPGGWDAPVRAHLLLEHAVALVATAARAADDPHAWVAAVDYAAAASPVAAAVAGAGAGVALPADAADPAGDEWAGAPPAHRLAALSGSAATAVPLTRELLRRRPCASDADVLAVVSQARRLGLDDVASAACLARGRLLLGRGGTVGAARWLIRADSAAGLRVLAATLFVSQLSALRAGVAAWRQAGRPTGGPQSSPLQGTAVAPPPWLEAIVQGQRGVEDVCASLPLPEAASSGSHAAGGAGRRGGEPADPALGAASALLVWLENQGRERRSGPVAGAPLLAFVVRLWRLSRALLLSFSSADTDCGPLVANDLTSLIAALVPPAQLAACAGATPVPCSVAGAGAMTMPTPLITTLVLLGRAAGLLTVTPTSAERPQLSLSAPQARLVVAALRYERLGAVHAGSESSLQGSAADAGSTADPAAVVEYPQPTSEELQDLRAAVAACAAAAVLAARVF